MGSAIKLSKPLVDAARSESRLRHRSMTQQIEHWARLGRAVERMGAVDSRKVRAALAAEIPFDSLEAPERAAVLGSLEEVAYMRDGDSEFAAELAAEGGTEPWPT